jgi:hypothetical protein
MKQRYHAIREDNERESNNTCHMFLTEAYSFIERKLKNREFQNGFTEYEQEVKAL